jgi:integrase
MPRAESNRGLRSRINAAGEEVWYVRLSIGGRMQHFGSFATAQDARNFYQQAKTEERQGRFFPETHKHQAVPSLRALIEAWEIDPARASAPQDTTYKTWWLDRCDRLTLTDCTPAWIDEQRRQLERQGLAPQTVLHYLKFLRHLLNRAVRDDLLPGNPFAKVRLPKPAPAAIRFLSPREEQRLLKALAPRDRLVIRLALVTGLRSGEQFSLRWEQIDWKSRTVTLPRTKAGQPQYRLLSREAIEILTDLKRRAKSSPWVLPSRHPATHLIAKNFYHRQFLPAIEKAKLPHLTWHHLRHTFASRLAMSGQSDQTIAALLGHASTALVKRYAHLSPSHLKDAVEHASRFTGRRTGQKLEK